MVLYETHSMMTHSIQWVTRQLCTVHCFTITLTILRLVFLNKSLQTFENTNVPVIWQPEELICCCLSREMCVWCILDVSVSWGHTRWKWDLSAHDFISYCPLKTTSLHVLKSTVSWRFSTNGFWRSTVYLINCHHGDLKEIKEMEGSILILGNVRSSLWPWWRKTNLFL